VGAKRGQKGRTDGRRPSIGGRQRLALIIFGATFVLLFIGFAVAQGIGSPGIPSGDVASVEGVSDEIGDVSQEELDRAIKQQAAEAKLKKPPAPGSKKYEELASAALSGIVEGVWLQGEAEELGITVTDKQVENELATIKKQSFPTPSSYKKFLKESGFTPEEVENRVRLQVLSTQIQEAINSQAPAPSSSEVKDYYEAEKAKQFTAKESRDARIILNEDKKKIEEAKALLEKDQSPANWEKVAPKFSGEPTAVKEGGLQKGITEEFLQGPIKAAIFDSATGELVGPVKFEKNWILVEVVKLTPAKTQTLAEVKSQISQTLQQENQQEYLTEFVSKYQSKWQSRTRCASSVTDGITNPQARDGLARHCSNVTPSGRPANAPEACYEADPKTPAEACPAPVTPNSPALPGSINEEKPKGEPFPQRPRPEKSAEGEAGTEVPAGTPPPAESSGEEAGGSSSGE
jgi:parvulin-like peptidyl-prolyl isomerase